MKSGTTQTRGVDPKPEREPYGTIAQLVERVVEAHEVGGSNPSRPTMKYIYSLIG